MEIRGLPEERHTLMYISERMKRIGDLATKLKFVYDDIKKTDEIKIFRDKFHLPDNENINIIETGEEIIVYRRDTEYVESSEDKYALVNVREEVLKEQENELEIKEMELKSKEISLKNMEDMLKKTEEDLKCKERSLANMAVVLIKDKERILDENKKVEEKLRVEEEKIMSKENVFKHKKEYLSDYELELSEKDDNLSKRDEVLNVKEESLKKREQELKFKEKNMSEKEKQSIINASRNEELKLMVTLKQEEINSKVKEINLKCSELRLKEYELLKKQADIDEKEKELKFQHERSGREASGMDMKLEKVEDRSNKRSEGLRVSSSLDSESDKDDEIVPWFCAKRKASSPNTPLKRINNNVKLPVHQRLGEKSRFFI